MVLCTHVYLFMDCRILSKCVFYFCVCTSLPPSVTCQFTCKTLNYITQLKSFSPLINDNTILARGLRYPLCILKA